MYLFTKKANSNEFLYFFLTEIFGIGQVYSLYLCKKLGFTKLTKIKEITGTLNFLLVRLVKRESLILLDLKRNIQTNVKSKIFLKSYKGIRHKQGLPVRGQNTKNNAKTQKKSKKY